MFIELCVYLSITQLGDRIFNLFIEFKMQFLMCPGIYNLFKAKYYKHFGNNCILLPDIWKYHIFKNGNAKEKC